AEPPAQLCVVPPDSISASPVTVLAPLRRAQSISPGVIGVASAAAGCWDEDGSSPSWAQPPRARNAARIGARISPRERSAGFMGRRVAAGLTNACFLLVAPSPTLPPGRGRGILVGVSRERARA